MIRNLANPKPVKAW